MHPCSFEQGLPSCFGAMIELLGMATGLPRGLAAGSSRQLPACLGASGRPGSGVSMSCLVPAARGEA